MPHVGEIVNSEEISTVGAQPPADTDAKTRRTGLHIENCSFTSFTNASTLFDIDSGSGASVTLNKVSVRGPGQIGRSRNADIELDDVDIE